MYLHSADFEMGASSTYQLEPALTWIGHRGYFKSPGWFDPRLWWAMAFSWCHGMNVTSIESLIMISIDQRNVCEYRQSDWDLVAPLGCVYRLFTDQLPPLRHDLPVDQFPFKKVLDD